MSTTDVIVVTDGLSGTATSNSYYTSNITGLLSSSGTTLTTSTGLVYGTPTTNFFQTPARTVTTYDEFWKFDEQWDIFWKSFFEKNSVFKPISEKAVNHPCDIQETENGLRIELAAVGLEKSDINILVDSETLRVSHRKQDTPDKSEEHRYIQRSIKRASFDIAWKISSKYELNKLEANLEKGLLILDIPFAKENKPKRIEIK
jgi:HSP20 family protein